MIGRGAGAVRAMGALAMMLTVASAPPAPAAAGDTALDYAPAIRAMPEIRNGLGIVAIGDLIRRNCPTIGAQWFNVWRFGRKLQRLARDAGFSDDQIEAYVEDDAEKDYYLGLARRWLAERGVREGERESYCKVGHAEIERQSQLGVLLWSQES